MPFDFIQSLDLPSILIGFVIGTFLKLYSYRPKIKVNGSGSQGHSNIFRTNYLSIQNEIGWFGLNIPETRIFGIRVHPNTQFGLPFQKTAANDCRAQLFIKDTNEFICQLWWKGEGSLVEEVKTIPSGESAQLMLFSAKNGEGKYFPYQPNNKETGEIRQPPEKVMFSDTTKFCVHIHHSYNQIFKYDLTVSKKFDGKFYIETESGGGFFFE